MEKLTPRVFRTPLAVRIILPPMLSIGLFVIAIYFIFLPVLEDRIIAAKRQMIRELVETAWGTLAEYEARAATGIHTRAEAQARAIAHLRSQRYGPEKKDYFWITDMQTRMVMHPYLSHLEGRDMSDYKDPAGNLIVVEMTRVARRPGAGFVEYIWQWKDNPERVGPKLSYIKRFDPWQWVVGTGIYLEDVAIEVTAIRRQLALVSLGILAVSVILLAYVIRQSFKINTERRRVLDVLRGSEENYRSVMMAVPDPVVVYDIEGRVQYINPAFSRFFGWNLAELVGSQIDFVPESSREGTVAKIKETIDHGHCIAYETQRYNKSGDLVDVCVSAANYRDDAGNPLGIVVNLHDISEQKRTEDELVKHRENLEELVRARTAELETSLARVKTLSGLVPICSACKKIRDDKGFWNQIDSHIEQHSEALFSHGLCPDCTHDLYKDQAWYKKKHGDW